MSATSRALELTNLGLTQSEAIAWLVREREAVEQGFPTPELPSVVLEKYAGMASQASTSLETPATQPEFEISEAEREQLGQISIFNFCHIEAA